MNSFKNFNINQKEYQRWLNYFKKTDVYIFSYPAALKHVSFIIYGCYIKLIKMEKYFTLILILNQKRHAFFHISFKKKEQWTKNVLSC